MVADNHNEDLALVLGSQAAGRLGHGCYEVDFSSLGVLALEKLAGSLSRAPEARMLLPDVHRDIGPHCPCQEKTSLNPGPT